jgi:sulfofructose kinase
MPIPEVVCVGLATADTIVPLRSWPEPDGRLVADPIVRSGGGPAATAAVTQARLGRDAAFVGAIGDDEAGDAARAGLVEAGVDVAGLRTVPGRTAESVILVDRSSDTRSILHAPGVALDHLEARPLAGASWVHADHAGHRLLSGVARDRLSVDDGTGIDGVELDGLALYAPSLAALRARYPGVAHLAAVRAALDDGARRVVVTLGGDGAVAAEPAAAWRVPRFDAEVVSTLGAGDVFHGALLAMLLECRELPEAARLANVAAALSCRALDGRGAIPDRAELEAGAASAPPVEPIVLDSTA